MPTLSLRKTYKCENSDLFFEVSKRSFDGCSINSSLSDLVKDGSRRFFWETYKQKMTDGCPACDAFNLPVGGVLVSFDYDYQHWNLVGIVEAIND